MTVTMLPGQAISQHDSEMTTHILFEGDKEDKLEPLDQPYSKQIIWYMVIMMTYIHIAGVYGYFVMWVNGNLATLIFEHIYGNFSAFGISAGVHKLWSHRSYRAKRPLSILLMLCNSAIHQNSIYSWARDHRLHHKFTETDADPYNAKRGFFFSHVGWLLVKKHPLVRKMGLKIDLSDLESDPVVMFQKKYFVILMLLFCFIIPTVIPVYFLGETWWNSYHCTMARYMLLLNSTWFINSVSHKFGTRAFDKSIRASDSAFVMYTSLGEGWHNYHHVFPWDSQNPDLAFYNPTNRFINLFGKIGWAYDLKTVSMSLVKKRMARTGDGSLGVWGWPDKDIQQEDREKTSILYKKVQ